MGRTPIIGTGHQRLRAVAADPRLHRSHRARLQPHGRRDNMYKARIKILVKAEGQKFFDQVNAEFSACWRDVAVPAHSSRRPSSTV
jgi:sulfite reductase (NADPH) hemoprotein beta-component